jgi:hypothetical protein
MNMPEALVADALAKANEEIVLLTAERDAVRSILAGTDIGSLPNDWTLSQIAEARMDDIHKYIWQVRDTCARAEKAEAERDHLKASWDPLVEWAQKYDARHFKDLLNLLPADADQTPS